MKAAIDQAHGEPENLVYVDGCNRPLPGHGDVVIRLMRLQDSRKAPHLVEDLEVIDKVVVEPRAGF